MRQKFSGILALIGFLFTSSVSIEVSAQEWARKMFKEFQHDFGNVTKPDQPEYRFEVENIYKEEIRIKDVFSSCGCTTVSITNRNLKTYEKAYIVTRFNSHIVDGFKQATVTVRFDAPFIGEVQLVVKGNAIRSGSMSVSSSKIDFGEVANGLTADRTFEVYQKGNPNFKIDDVLSTFPHIGVSVREKFRGQNQVTYEVVARLKESVPEGYSQGELFIVGDEGGQKVKVPVTFTAHVVAPVQISPGILTLSPVKPGEVVTRKVIVKADMPFEIVDVTCHKRSFSVRTDGTKKKVHFVEVTYTGESDPGRHECYLTFLTNIGDGAETKMKAIVDIVPESETTSNGSTVSKNDVGSR